VSLLSVKDLHASLGGKPVLKNLSFEVAAGEFVGLIGPNGAGKSTLLRTILGFVPHQGSVAVNGHDTASLSARERARHVAYLPQERDIAWPVSVETIVALGRFAHRPALAAANGADREIVERAMRRMEIDGFRDRSATELSGGEKARVLIARALAQDAPLLLADEPAAGLDPSHQIALMKTFAMLASEGNGVVASMHDLGLAARWCSRLILLDNGVVVADGPPREVLTAARLHSVYRVEAYFGEAGERPIIQPLDLIAADRKPG
jgi:iron complex transport system ATP-binding protein